MPRAGLAPATVVEAAADLADETGFDHLSMGKVADRLGVRTPSLYKHVEGLDDLAHRIAVLAAHELSDTIRDATQGRSAREALAAAARAMRAFVNEHPGRYAAINAARRTGSDDPLEVPTARFLASFAAVLHGYRLDPAQEVHAMRMLRSMLHGFADLELARGFQLDTDVDESFTWLLDFVDRGLRALVADSP